MNKLNELFDLRIGSNLDLCYLEPDPNGVAFVSRSGLNNGVTGKVKELPNIKPTPAGHITVAMVGSILSSFLQNEPSYQSQNMMVLVSKQQMTDLEKLYYCAAIKMNAYKYSYGRNAHKTLKDLEVPDLPDWVKDCQVPNLSNCTEILKFSNAETWMKSKSLPNLLEYSLPLESEPVQITNWKKFKLVDLFDIEKGKPINKFEAEEEPGNYPLVSCAAVGNGVVAYTKDWEDKYTLFQEGYLTISVNGRPGVAFYQEAPFYTTTDVWVSRTKKESCEDSDIPKSAMLFIATAITNESYRFSYVRKLNTERLNTLDLWLPATLEGKPDYELMDRYMKSLRFSSILEEKGK